MGDVPVDRTPHAPLPSEPPEHQHDGAQTAGGLAANDDGDPQRVALISLHTSPLDQPGTGDAGGMNVYIMAVARRLAEQGVDVDIYTRCHGEGGPQVEEVSPKSRVIRVQAGPCAELPKEELPKHLPQFLDGLLAYAGADSGNPRGLAGDPSPHRHSPYDVVHSHYWLSGWVGSRAKRIWGVPHVASFHTLGKVKNDARGPEDRSEPPARLDGEQRVVDAADRILTPTSLEADDLVNLYGADPRRIRVVPPGVDRSLFVPRPKAEARARLHLGDVRLVLFVGRLQPFKGPDVAVRAVAEAIRRAPAETGDMVLGVVGGPAGPRSGPDEVAGLMELAAGLGLSDRVLFFPPQPHSRLADFYSAAEAVLVPSRSESFGLVALEAQACGTPVIAAAAGGLRQVVVDGRTGLLIEGRDPARFADGILRLLRDRRRSEQMGREAILHARRFSWDATAAEIRDVYAEVQRPLAG